MSERFKNFNRMHAVGLLVALLLIASPLFVQFTDDSDFPDSFMDMQLMIISSGDAAIDDVLTLHSSEGIALDNAYIVKYKNPQGKTATFWISESSSKTDAVLLLDDMNREIPSSKVFSLPIEMNIEGTLVYYTEGIGEFHYYYAKGNRVYWIALSEKDEAVRMDAVRGALKLI